MSKKKKKLPTVGYVGLGIMGRPMAENLRKAGHPVVCWNRTRSKAAALKKKGAVVVDTPAEVARNASIICVNVTDTKDVKKVVLGKDGIASGAKKGSIVIDFSTISDAGAIEIAKALKKKGISFLDAPVTGGMGGAIQGILSIMVGGEKRAFNRALPVMKTMGKRVVHMGPSGAGQRTKIANQIICGLSVLAVAEAFSFAKKAGVDMKKAFEVISTGAAASFSMNNFWPAMTKKNHDPGFKISLARKDLAIADRAAKSIGLELKGNRHVLNHYRRLEKEGLGELGTQAIVRAFSG